MVAFGSDFPIDSADPRLGIAALQASTHPEVNTWGRQRERLSPYECFDGYWRRAAHLAFDERHLGRLRPGYFADLVCLDADPFAHQRATELNVLATYIGGRRVYPQEEPEKP